MRILFVDQFSDAGGAQRCFLDLLPAFEERGWQVKAALPGNGALASRLHAAPLSCGPYRSGPKSGADLLRFVFDVPAQARTVSELLSQDDFDLIYVNGPRVLPGVVFATRGRVPILFHVHNYLDRWYAKALTGWIARARVNSVIACSEFVARPLRRYVSAPKLQVIPNGSSDLGYRRRSFELPWRIGIVGRIEPQKGQAEFVQAARQVPDAQFLVSGIASAASAGYFESVKELARGWPVEFLGWQEDRAALFANLDLLVIASRQEGLPLVALEALSAGVPVVAFAVGGIPEVIRHEKTGFLVPERTPQALVTEIQRLMNGSRDKLVDVAGAARVAWERSFDISRYRERMVEALLKVAAAG
jgi:glycosyltransferase involved in cell wall biosynthesis